MKHSLALTCLMVLAAPVVASEVSFDWDYTLSGSSAQHRDSSLLGKSSDSSSETIDALIDLQLEGYGFTGLIAAKGNQIYSSDSSESYDGELIIQELFWHLTGSRIFCSMLVNIFYYRT